MVELHSKTGDFSGLGLGGGLRHVGANYGDLSNSQRAPSYVLVDASVHYNLSKVHSKLHGMRQASCIAYQQELDVWLNPELFQSLARGQLIPIADLIESLRNQLPQY